MNTTSSHIATQELEAPGFEHVRLGAYLFFPIFVPLLIVLLAALWIYTQLVKP